MSDVARILASPRSAISDTVRHGVIGGALAGVAFAVAEMFLAEVSGGQTLAPLQAITGVLLQQAPAGIAPALALLIGLPCTVAYAAAIGAVLALAVARVPLLRSTPVAILALSVVAGFVLWPVNFYLIAPALHAPWLALGADRVQQFICHTYLFGGVLGWYLARHLVANSRG